MDYLSCMPPPIATELREVDLRAARQIRLRVNRPVKVEFAGAPFVGRYVLPAASMRQTAEALTAHALSSSPEKTAQGFMPLKGGHRLGLCGTWARGQLRDISSLCLRLAHEIIGVSNEVLPQLMENGAFLSTLLLGAPGTGKTTLLRDIVRALSTDGKNVGVADERGEICALQGGVPMLDIGKNTDVVEGLEKSQALLNLTRTVAPDILAADEIGSAQEIATLKNVMGLGLPVLITAHGRTMTDIALRGLDALLCKGGIRRVVVLKGIGNYVIEWVDASW